MQKSGRLLGAVCQNCHRIIQVRSLATEPSPSRVTADLEDRRIRKPKHFYTSGYASWNTQDQLAQHLHSQIVFHNDDYIAFNKPPGIPMTVNSDNPPILYKGSSVHNLEIPEFATLSMNASVAEISKKINLKKDVRLGLPNSRLNSGIVIYTKNTKAHEQLRTWWRNTRANKIFSIRYWALTMGIPVPKSSNTGEDVFYVQPKKDQSSLMKFESLQFASRDKRKDGKAIQSNMKHKILAANYDLNVALVEVQPTWSVNDMVPLYLTHKLSPILGDHIYSHLVATVGGVPMLIAANVKDETPQKLLPEIHRALSIKKGDNVYVPLHLHLAQAVVPSVGKKNAFHTINAPLPDLFLESLRRLDIKYEGEPEKVTKEDLKAHNLHVQK